MSIFKTKWDAADMAAADDAKWAPAVVQVPSDAPWEVIPDLNTKSHWPAHVVNTKRPRFGRNQD